MPRLLKHPDTDKVGQEHKNLVTISVMLSEEYDAMTQAASLK